MQVGELRYFQERKLSTRPLLISDYILLLCPYDSFHRRLWWLLPYFYQRDGRRYYLHAGRYRFLLPDFELFHWDHPELWQQNGWRRQRLRTQWLDDIAHQIPKFTSKQRAYWVDWWSLFLFLGIESLEGSHQGWWIFEPVSSTCKKLHLERIPFRRHHLQAPQLLQYGWKSKLQVLIRRLLWF